MTVPSIPANPKGVQCPTHGPVNEVVAKEYTAKSGLPAFHLRAACPSCDQWVKFINQPGPWFIPRSHLGRTKRIGYYKGVRK